MRRRARTLTAPLQPPLVVADTPHHAPSGAKPPAGIKTKRHSPAFRPTVRPNHVASVRPVKPAAKKPAAAGTAVAPAKKKRPSSAPAKAPAAKRAGKKRAKPTQPDVFFTQRVPSVVLEPSRYHRTLRRLADDFCGAEASAQWADDILLRAIERVYELPRDSAHDSARKLHAALRADNPEEDQEDFHVFGMLAVTVLNRPLTVRVPNDIAGTDTYDGHAAFSLFYRRRLHGGGACTYAQALLHVMGAMLEALQEWEASGCEGADPCPRFTDYFLQVLEACFNCVGRHKEAFELIVRGYIEMRQGVTDRVSATERDAVSEKTGAVKMHFSAWLDAYKIHALRAAVIDPLLFLLRHRYDVWENIESHGMSFWSTIVEAALDIPMPLERLGSLDTGWGWGARFVDDEKDLHAEVLRRCAENVGVGWRSALRGLKAPRKGADVPKLLKMNNLPVDIYFEDMPEFVDYLSEQRLPSQILEKLASTLQRFAAHLSAERIAKRFTLHLINRSDSLPPCVQALQPTQYLDATDPEDVQYDMDGLFSMLASVGVPLRETVSSFKKPKGRGKPTQRGTV